jgi:hypothetical protein
VVEASDEVIDLRDRLPTGDPAAHGGAPATPRRLRLIPRATSLHSKVMLSLATLVALVALACAYVLIESERERRMLELEGRATRLAELFSRSVAYPLWNVDRAAVEGQLAALASNPEVAQFSVTTVGDDTLSEIVNIKDPDLVDPVVRVQPIVYARPGGKLEKIGSPCRADTRGGRGRHRRGTPGHPGGRGRHRGGAVCRHLRVAQAAGELAHQSPAGDGRSNRRRRHGRALRHRIR